MRAADPRRVAREVRRRAGIHHLLLAGTLALAAGLDLNRLAQNGWGNAYYAAADASMLRSLHNFLYVAADPGGLLSIDKPPLGLWLQAGSAKVFGLAPLSVLVPQALLAIVCVLVMYLVVARRFGRAGGLAAALALATFPAYVAVARDNNVDPLLIAFMLFACAAALRAIDRGSGRWLLVSAALIGCAFETKALAALLVVPGIALAWLRYGPERRLATLLGAAGLALAICSLWIAFVDLTPAAQRPHVIGSQHNSVLDLTLHYNGIGRVAGEVGGPGRVAQFKHPPPEYLPNGRRSGPVTFGGPTGPLRLTDVQLGAQGAWLLPLALAGLVAIAANPFRRRATKAALLVLGGWFGCELAVLSFGQGIIHPYYISALAPGAAAMFGAGVVSLADMARRSRRGALMAVAGVGATVWLQIVLLDRDRYLHWLVAPLLIAAGLGLAALIVHRRRAGRALTPIALALLIAPAAYAATTWQVPVDGTFPSAGPHTDAGFGGIGVSPGLRALDEALIGFVRRHGPGRRWAVLTESATVAAPLTLLGADAAALGGYSSTDRTIGAAQLARLIRRGDVHWILLGGAYSSRGGNALTAAVQRACPEVPRSIWRYGGPLHTRHHHRHEFPSEGRYVLYDCGSATVARRLAAAARTSES